MLARKERAVKIRWAKERICLVDLELLTKADLGSGRGV